MSTSLFLPLKQSLTTASRLPLHYLLRNLSTTAAIAPETESAPITKLSETGPSLETLSYHIHRTPSQQLPIYHLAKRGGNLHQTRLRKIEGNVDNLRIDLKEALNLEDKHITINRLTGHIIIKGWKKHQVAKFLTEKKF